MHSLRTLLCLAALATAASAQTPAAAPAAAPAPKETQAFPLAPLSLLLDPEVVNTFASLPVQENGRVKPLETVARFRLLRFFGKQHIVATDSGSSMGGMGQPDPVPVNDPSTGKAITNDKGKPQDLSAVQWLLVSLFRPDIARDLPVFVVDNSEAVEELGLPGKGKRDHYSMNALSAGRQVLMEKMNQIRAIESKQQTPVQHSLAKLAIDFLEYEIILGHFDFARRTFKEHEKDLPPELAGMVKDGRPDWEKFLPALTSYFAAHPDQAAPMANPWLREVWMAMLGGLMSGNPEIAPRLFPPPVASVEAWSNPGTTIQDAISGKSPSEHDLKSMTQWGSLLASAGDAATFKKAIKTYSEDITKRASDRKEAGTVAIERHFHKADYFTNALYFFIFGLLVLAVSWVNPAATWAKYCRWICTALLACGAAYGTIGIAIRCIIMNRPPITNLYETIIFITTAGVILALLAEWVMKRGLAIAVAAVLGTVGMFLQLAFMNFEGKDTMEPLQAVLMTNFWLATHVVCINLGYATAMVASFCSVGYVIARSLGRIKLGDDTAREFTRLSYAFTCGGLFLSLIGTVLGGIWANYSWGRFWGWDPKENGALLIVLMNLIILHARLGGFIREVGLHCANVFQGIVVAFSWFATNQLGIGLHAYGELEGAWKWLYRFWGFMSVIIIIGMVLSVLDRRSKKSTSREKEIEGEPISA